MAKKTEKAERTEKLWFALGFWHAKLDIYSPPYEHVAEYLQRTTKTNVYKEYEDGYEAGKEDNCGE